MVELRLRSPEEGTSGVLNATYSWMVSDSTYSFGVEPPSKPYTVIETRLSAERRS